jgi:hypothetical protein
MAGVYEFESLDWVKDIVQAESVSTKKHVDPTAAFNFDEDFSVGTIHGKNDAAHAAAAKKGATEITDLADDDEVSILTAKTQDDTGIPATLEQHGGTCSTGDRVRPGTSPPAIGPTADATPAGATGSGPVAVTGTEGSTDGGPGGK